MGKQEVDGQMSRQKVDSNAEAEKKIPSVGLVNEIWDKRRKSNLVKWLMAKSNVSMEEMADYLDCSKQYLNNKFSRDCFSMEDTVIAAYACDCTLAVMSNDGRNIQRLDPEEFLSGDEEAWKRVTALRDKSVRNRRAEYEQRKAELERMRREYGFED